MMDGSLLVLGIAGPELSADEAALFRKLQPAGYILFTRNIVTAKQTRKLTDDLRDLATDTPIIAIDQEGGRVTRTKEIAPPAPSAAAVGGGIRSASSTAPAIGTAGCGNTPSPAARNISPPAAARNPTRISTCRPPPPRSTSCSART